MSPLSSTVMEPDQLVAIYPPATRALITATRTTLRAAFPQATESADPSGLLAGEGAQLVEACERFAAGRGSRGPHFLFGPLSDDEWARWGYKHMDHHLRQFGV